MTKIIIRLTTVLALGILLALSAACGGPQTRQERAQETAERQSDVAAQDAEDAANAAEILDNHSIEAIRDANEIANETPEAPPAETP